MDFIQDLVQSFDLGSAPLIIVVCCCLCGGLFIGGLVLSIVGGFLDIIFGLFEFLLNIIQGGPLAWCGCFVLMVGGCGCGCVLIFGANLLATCGTPEQINLCRFLGY